MNIRSLKGFTLVEILIALFILGMGMSLIYAIFPLGFRMSRQIQTMGRVSFFAQKKIEELKISNQTLSESSGQENVFNWTIKIEDFTTEENIVLKKIQLDALWPEGQNIKRKTFVTYFKN